MKESRRVQAGWFPKIGAAGFTYLDGSAVFALLLPLNRLTPPEMKSGLSVFLRKK